MKKIGKIVLIGVVCLMLLAGGFLFYLTRGLNEVQELNFSDINLENIEDGLYRGEFESGRFTNKIEVKVENNQIVELIIKDDVTFGLAEVPDKLFDRIFETQSLDVDAVSEATVTSNAYLKAIEDALVE